MLQFELFAHHKPAQLQRRFCQYSNSIYLALSRCLVDVVVPTFIKATHAKSYILSQQFEQHCFHMAQQLVSKITEYVKNSLLINLHFIKRRFFFSV